MNRKNFIFPTDFFDKNKPDCDFENEYIVAKTLGHGVGLYSTLEDIRLPERGEIIVRGWMMKQDEYKNLETQISICGGKIINSLPQYLLMHHFPEIYPHISQYSPKTICSVGIIDAKILRKKLNDDFPGKSVIVKDWVKSIKEGVNTVFLIESSDTVNDIKIKLYTFLEKRGDSFDTGFVFKEFIDLYKDNNGLTNEWRVFVYKDIIIDYAFNSNSNESDDCPSMNLIQDVIDTMKTTPIKSNFYTLDFAKKTDGTYVLIEVGDGQVSGPAVHTNLTSFYNKF